MATQQEITALCDAHLKNDHSRFRATMLAIAANSEATSPKFARDLRRLHDKPPQDVAQFIALSPKMAEKLSMSHPEDVLDDMVLDERTREPLDRFLSEQASREKLGAHGLSPMRKLLFVGPPGTGKTSAAAALASSLSLPLMRVELSSVISSYMGETGANLAQIFASIRQLRGVYMFDEFDAVAPARDIGGDHGESRRFVNTLLQLMDDDKSESIMIAATNLHGMLDPAIYRRFDQITEFSLPTIEQAEALLRARLLWTTGLHWELVRATLPGISHADLTVACDQVNKNAVMADRTTIQTDDIITAILARRVPTQKGRTA